MESSGFFNSEVSADNTYDRSYVAEDFANYFKSFVGNGVFQNISSALLVTESTSPNMSVVVSPGRGFIDGYWYENTADLQLPVGIADGVLGRIDMVVMRLGYSEREIVVMVKPGTPSAAPEPPELQRDSDYYELCLAQLNITAGLSSVRAQNIVDTRMDANLCGFVQAAVQSIDTTYFGNQLNQFITRYIAQADEDYEEYESAIEEEYSKFQEEFRSLLERLRELIDDDDALGQLLLLQQEQGTEISQNTSDISTLNTDFNRVDASKENRYERVSVTIPATDWVQDVNTEFWEYSFETDYPATSYDIEIDLNWDVITQDQIKDYSRAGIVGSHVTNKLVARSKQPTTDYPMMLFVTFRGVS